MKEAREARALSQRGLVRELADLGVPLTQAAVSWIESGDRKVSLDEAVAIARVLRVPLAAMYQPSWRDYLVDEAEAGPPTQQEAV